ncbi:MAG TPA: hypothetical protein VMS31_00195 [Pyrinomonadaceae bacterium]|nr:hypothetical protein [Pyrinomonadaceae bacterium]
MKFLVVLIALTTAMMSGATSLGQGLSPQTAVAADSKIETTYDSVKDRTTVRLAPVKLSGEKDKYRSLHMSPSFSFPGRQPAPPAIIDFELQTVVKARLLDSDLYVVFIVDGDKIHLSSNRWAIARPVPGRRWIGERLVFRMPYDLFVRLTKAKKVDIKFAAVVFEVSKPQLETLRKLKAEMQ